MNERIEWIKNELPKVQFLSRRGLEEVRYLLDIVERQHKVIGVINATPGHQHILSCHVGGQDCQCGLDAAEAIWKEVEGEKGEVK
jgi:hypothetical protein